MSICFEEAMAEIRQGLTGDEELLYRFKYAAGSRLRVSHIL